MGRVGWLEMPGCEPLKDEAGTAEYDEGACLDKALENLYAGNPERALRFYTRGLALNPDCEAAWAGQVQALLDLDEVKEARAWANKGLDKFPRCVELQAAKAVALTRLADFQQALRVSDYCMSMKQQNWYVWMARGYVLLRKGETNALHCMRKGLEGDAFNWQRNLRAAIFCLDSLKPDMAVPFIKTALQGASRNSLVLFQAGRTWEDLDARFEALAAYEKASRLPLELRQACVQGMARVKRQGPWRRFKAWVRGKLILLKGERYDIPTGN